MKGIFAFLKRLLGILEDDVDSIIEPMAAIVRKLDAHAENQVQKAEEAAKEAERLLSESETARRVAKRATTLAAKYEELVGL